MPNLVRNVRNIRDCYYYSAFKILYQEGQKNHIDSIDYVTFVQITLFFGLQQYELHEFGIRNYYDATFLGNPVKSFTRNISF